MVLFACETVPSSGDLLAPVVHESVPSETQPAPLDVATDEDRVPGEPDPEEEEGSVEPSGALDAHLLEITGAPPSPEEEPAVTEEEPPARLDVNEPAVPQPSMLGVGSAAWGPRVLTTLSSLEPPRAVLALPDGSERVVRPGTLLPEIGGVVIAIGRDVVELSEVREQGVYASVHTRTIPALIPESDQP
jgi:hypothetical protein